MRTRYNGVEPSAGSSVTAASIITAVADPDDAADVNAALGNGAIPNDLSTATTTNGSGTASVTAGVASTSLLAAATGVYAGGTWTGPRVKLADAAPFPGSFRVVARLASLSGSSDSYAYFGVVSEADNRFRGWRVRGHNGASACMVDTSVLVTPANSPRDGTTWFAYQRVAGSQAWWYGTGTSTDPPAAWTEGETAADTSPPDGTVVFGLAKSDTSDAAVATWDNVRIGAL